MSDHDIERLCAVYREAVEDAPYDAADATLLRAAARGVRGGRRLPRRRLAYGIAATLLAAFGLAAGMRSLIVWHRVNIEARTATTRETGMLSPASAARHDHFATFVAPVSRRALLQQGDTGFLQETSALWSTQADPTCGTAAEVDLNSPGALASLEVTKPRDYVKIVRIIAGVTRHPELDVARWISATFHAGNVSYLPLWLTSLPPKRRLSFCLEDTGYSVVLTITRNGARVSPAAPHGTPGIVPR